MDGQGTFTYPNGDKGSVYGKMDNQLIDLNVQKANN